MRQTLIYSTIGIGFFAISALLLWMGWIAYPVEASVSVTDEYQATSTAANTLFGATITGDRLIKTGQGSLGSIVITGANTGVVNFYNATTSDVLKRTGNKATSTILLVSLPASLVAGTYVFDVEFTDGLFLDYDSGNMPTTTITYR